MTDLGLALRQLRYTNKSFWRNPASAFFTFAFPLMFLVIFTVLFRSGRTCVQALANGSCGREVATSTFYVATITAFSVITACYTNIAISVTASREAGVLKRTRGTPLPAWTYLWARISHAVLVSILLVVVCATFGALFYDAEIPTSTVPAFLLTLVVGAATFCALGLAVTSIIPNADAAPAVVNATILPLLFISNVFIPLENPPGWLETLANIFPVKHFVQAMLDSYFPLPGRDALPGRDLLIVALWGIGAVLVAIRYFSWEPRR
jgi:ABC-2 type transport system permease protein